MDMNSNSQTYTLANKHKTSLSSLVIKEWNLMQQDSFSHIKLEENFINDNTQAFIEYLLCVRHSSEYLLVIHHLNFIINLQSRQYCYAHLIEEKPRHRAAKQLFPVHRARMWSSRDSILDSLIQEPDPSAKLWGKS